MLPVRAARLGLKHTCRTLTLPAIPRQFHFTAAHGNGEEQFDRVKRRNSPHSQHGTSTLIDNAPGWNEELATASEASVKADRETTTISEMQEKTVNYVQSQYNTKDDDPDIESTRASYARDEVDGPLGSAGVGEFEGVVGKDDLGLDEMDVDSDGRVVTRRVVHEKTTVRGSGSGTDQANA